MSHDKAEFSRHPPSQRSEPERLFRAVPIVDGESTEPARFVGVHPLRWHSALPPDFSFVEVDVDELEKLRRQRNELLEACRQAFDIATMDVNQFADKYGPDYWRCDVTSTLQDAITSVEGDE